MNDREDTAKDNGKLATAFRELRESWFSSTLLRRAPEREWEEEEEELARERNNAELKAVFDRQTEEIIAGLDRVAAPRCSNDLRSRRR